jgi:hypothetical protein
MIIMYFKLSFIITYVSNLDSKLVGYILNSYNRWCGWSRYIVRGLFKIILLLLIRGPMEAPR